METNTTSIDDDNKSEKQLLKMPSSGIEVYMQPLCAYLSSSALLSSSTIITIDDIKTLNKINGLKRELDRLSLQKYALDQACARQSQSLIALANLKSNGITEDRIIEINSFLENNGYNDTRFNSGKLLTQ